VALVRTDVVEEHSASIIGVTRIGELGTMLAVTSNRRTLGTFLALEILHGNFFWKIENKDVTIMQNIFV
jgi:hypothetical protein